ncbi:hypothetical protein VARIO8X_20049 [Burkholderiales bacterium 8X]|nr:hypothetical protein VARIO8X_20049 [Burkholderiales bacterium 8X]
MPLFLSFWSGGCIHVTNKVTFVNSPCPTDLV